MYKIPIFLKKKIVIGSILYQDSFFTLLNSCSKLIDLTYVSEVACLLVPRLKVWKK